MSTWEASKHTHDHSESRHLSLAPRRELQLKGFYHTKGKPAIDRVLGIFLLFLALLPMALVALIVRFRIGRPVVFKQTRVGRYGETFTLYKFRTMAPDRRRDDLPFEGDDRRFVHKTADDPRVSPVGARLRAWSLDELPQFANVVKGDMSLVGPRPEMPNIVDEYEPWQHDRHLAKPGLTGVWQISNREQLMKDCIQLDVDYVEQISFAKDLGILIKTPAAVLTRRGH